MARSSRVLVVGDDAGAVADALADATDVAAEAATPEAVADALGRVAAVVWTGPPDERFEGVLERIGSADHGSDDHGSGDRAALVVFGDGDATAALDAGADAFVRRGEGDVAALAARVERLGRPAAADGGARLDVQFRTIVEQAEDPIFLKDREGRYQYVNEAGASLFGRTPDAVIGATDADLFDDATAADIRADDERVLETGEPVTVEERREYGDCERVFQTVKHPYERDGEVVGVIGIARDVTDKREVETELERNQRAIRDLQQLASRPGTFEGKLDRAIAIGCERLELPVGFLTNIEGGTQTVVAAAGDHPDLAAGAEAPLSEAYCRKAIESEGLLAVECASEEGWADDPAYERFGLECYLGGTVLVDGDLYGTLCFAGTDGRERSFTEAELTFIELLVEWVGTEFERRERERDLERYEAIVRAVDDGVYELDADGRFTFVNPAMAALTGYDPGELEGEHVSLVKDDEETAAALEALLAGDADERTVEAPLQRKRGPPVTTEDSMTRLTDDGTVRGVVGVVRDVTEQRAHRAMLSELVASSRSLMQARDREEVAEMVANAVADVLGFELTVVRLYDRETDRLVPAGTTDAVDERVESVPVYGIEEGKPGEAFVAGEAREVGDTAALEDGHDRETVASALHLPMGVHGTISIGAPERDGFSDVDRQAAQLLATSAAAAANRAKRETEVREARERVDTLVDRINGLIQDTVAVLVEAGTREELERGVTEQLVATDPYAFAWIGRPDVATETVEATAWSGDAPALAEALGGLSLDREAAREAGDPTALALAEERSHVADLDAVPDDSVHAAAREAGMGSMIAVPLTYKDASYGVLTVYAAERDAFAERERVVLDALGRAVANAVNAIESGRILTTNRVVEMEFTVQDAALLFGRLSAQVDAEFELTGSVYQSDGSLRMYVTAEADADAVTSVLDGDDAVTEATVIADHEGELLVEVTVEASLIETLADYGAVTQAVTASDGVVRYTIELPYEADAREVFELVEQRYDGTDLVGYHEHERPVRTRQEFREAVTERFTDRQETAIRTAHLGGFFEWPRDVDGDALADSMDISRPTYHQHLRAAQRKVFDELFGADPDRRRSG